MSEVDELRQENERLTYRLFQLELNLREAITYRDGNKATADRWRARAEQAEARLAEDCEGQRCTCGGRPVEIGGAEHRPGCGQPEEARDGN